MGKDGPQSLSWWMGLGNGAEKFVELALLSFKENSGV